MKNLIVFVIAICVLFTGCFETCDTQPQIYFKPMNTQGKVIVGTKGVYPTDSLKLFYVLIQDNDTILVDNNNLSSFYKSDSICSLYLSSRGKDIFLLQYEYGDLDTLTFTITENKKRHPMCADITFTYNGVLICSDCDLNATHNVIKH